jgi:hypothetical protein
MFLDEQSYQKLSRKFDLPAEAIQPEMFDFFKIIAMGAKKYKMNNWLEEAGTKSSEKDMHASMFRHLAESSADYWPKADHESGLDPLLHLACRALMLYTRRQRGIIHEEDK